MTITKDTKTLTLSEVAQLLRMSERRLRDKAAAGKIPGAIKLEGLKKWLFPRKAIEEFMGVNLEEL